MSKRAIDTSTWFSPKLPMINFRKHKRSKIQISTLFLKPILPTKPVPKELYLPDDKLKEAVDLAIALGRPLLLQGEPGCGKTRLAYAVAYALGLPLETSYIKSTSRAQDLLYTYDAVNRLYDAQIGAEQSKGREAVYSLRCIGTSDRTGTVWATLDGTD